MSDLPEIIARFIASESLLDEDDQILVAVSGGADSVALLRVLCALGYTCGVAHFDHVTRDGASGKDAAFVESLATELDCLFYVHREAIKAGGGQSFEMVARDARYAFFQKIARDGGYSVLATGHHANDQAETILLRLLRGSGPVGLGGIAPRAERDGLRVVRPLLETPQGAIIAWLNEHGHAWREDHTNADTTTPRNRVRHELLPYLEEHFNPAACNALVRTARLMRRYNVMLPRGSAEVITQNEVGDYVVNRELFRALSKAEQGEVLQALARECGIHLGEAHAARTAQFIDSAQTGQQHDLGRGATLHMMRQDVLLVDPRASRTDDGTTVLPCPGSCKWGTFEVTTRIVKFNVPVTEYVAPFRQVFDADALPPQLTVRGWLPGDRIDLLGMAGSRKLQDIFTDLGVPAPKRSTIPVVVAGDEILWVVGCRRSHLAPVTPQTKHVLEIEVRHATE